MDDVKTVKEHLQDLKKLFLQVLIFCGIIFFGGFFLSEQLIIFLMDYFGLKLVVLSPLEFVRAQIRLSFFLMIALILPFFLVKAYLFAKPIFSKENNRRAIKYFFYSFFLAVIGFLFGVLIFSKFSLEFFGNLPQQITLMWGVYDTVNFIMFSGFAFALVTQIILIIPLLVRLELVDLKTFKKSRSVVIVLILTISAILTSPDPVTQIWMSVPMYVCFEVGLIISSLQKV